MTKAPIDLTQKKPRESSGSSSGNRFSYQINWAFLKLIELHKSGKEYVVILDFHDDVVVTNSETAPTVVDFYQIKTSKTKDWSEARLTSVKALKKGKAVSILGKLWQHKLNFPSNTGVLGFVSNKHCGLDMPEKQRDLAEISFGALDPECKKRLVAKLRAEHSLSTDPDCDQAIMFFVSPLRISSHAKDLKAELLEYCDGIVPSGEYPVTKLYRVIGDELRKQNDEEDAPKTMAELLKNKSVARSSVQHIIEKFLPSDQYAHIWQSIPRDEWGTGIKMGARKMIHEGFTRYAAQKQNQANKVAGLVGDAIQKELSAMDLGAIDSLAELFSEVIPKLNKIPSSVDENYVKGAIILEWYDSGNKQLPSTYPKSKGAAA